MTRRAHTSAWQGWVGVLSVAAVAVAIIGAAAAAIGGAMHLATPHDMPSTPVLTGTEDFAVWGTGADGAPHQWDPCTPIELVINDTGAPFGWRDDLNAALDMIEDEAADTFTIVGTTTEQPRPDRAPYQPARYGERWAPVLVGWAPSSAFPLLRAHDRGVAIPVAVGGNRQRQFISGQVVFHSDRELAIGGGDRSDAWRATFVHELLHLIGLDHVDDTEAMMYRYPGEGPIVLDPGDVAGLRALRTGTCRAAPRPTQVDLVTALPVTR